MKKTSVKKDPRHKSGEGFRKERPSIATKRDVNRQLQNEDIEGMRLNKYVAHCGVCSRRQAADLVKEGKISVNGKVVVEPFYQVKKSDFVTHEGKEIRAEKRHVYILMNKPKNVITTVSDERGRATVLDIIGEQVKERVFPVGRLDRDTTGLLLLTNDGELAQRLSHPRHEVKKIYHVTLDRPLARQDMQQVSAGVELEDGLAKVDEIGWLEGESKEKVVIVIHSGKNRIVRRIFEHLGYQAERLDRVYYGGLTKKDLPRGKFRFLTEREVVMLKHFT
jgi:23S rRNA pseudouridine2605 synthase